MAKDRKQYNESNITNIMNIPVPENFNDSEMSFIVDKLILPYAKI